MAFSRKYEIESEKNYDEFMKHLGLPSDMIEKGCNFEIVTEDGQNFTSSQHYPGSHSMTNKFTIGKDCDMVTIEGQEATVQMEGGKEEVDFSNYRQTSEIVGDELVEISTISGVTYEHVSKRPA
ncbi:gastrotropin [Pteropus vampyrus]|uniref:Gastrotropin n=1 Tax=Pteropus vampyrus TaxID=132908 RepID=A0A6P6CB98_PTEVA|nr:gastrotropin [Pteropus vampyrus]